MRPPIGILVSYVGRATSHPKRPPLDLRAAITTRWHGSAIPTNYSSWTGNMALLTACIQCHVKPFNTGDFRTQLQDAFMEMKTVLAITHPLWAGLHDVLFDLDIPESPDHTPDVLLQLALDATFLKSQAPAVFSMGSGVPCARGRLCTPRTAHPNQILVKTNGNSRCGTGGVCSSCYVTAWHVGSQERVEICSNHIPGGHPTYYYVPHPELPPPWTLRGKLKTQHATAPSLPMRFDRTKLNQIRVLRARPCSRPRPAARRRPGIPYLN